MKKILAISLAVLMMLSFAACGGSSDDTAETTEVAAAEAVVPAGETAVAEAADAGDASGEMGDASGEMGAASGEMGDASGEMGAASGEMGGSGEQVASSGDYEITVNGVTDTAHYEDSDNGDQSTKGFTITFNGATIEGTIDAGVWTATSGDAADQAVVAAVQAAFEANNTVGPQQ